MTFFVVVFALVLMYVCVPLRVLIFHPVKAVVNLLLDLFNYVRRKNWRCAKTGQLKCFMAHFGGGKTLSMAHYATRFYKKYNNKRVWDRYKKKYVTQKVHILSNFALTQVPVEPLDNLSQIVACARHNASIDDLNDTLTVTLILLDEASVQLNSRNFKTNIDALFLNTLLTCRHFHMNFWYSGQKFKLVDALLRSVTQTCVECRKVWRFMVLKEYDADEMEFASDPTMVKPRKRYGFFVTNGDYDAYDTLACVDNLEKSVREGDMLTEKEILELRGELNPDNDAVTNRSFKHKMRKRR